MRIKESVTIEEEISKWLRNKAKESQESVSEILNQMLKKIKESDGGIYSKMKETSSEINRLEQLQEKYTLQVQKLWEEGNKQEREEAKKQLEEETRRNKERLQRLIFCYKRLKELNLLEKFLQTKDDEQLRELAKEIYIHTVNCGNSVSNAVGWMDMQRMKGCMESVDFEKLMEKTNET